MKLVLLIIVVWLVILVLLNNFPLMNNFCRHEFAMHNGWYLMALAGPNEQQRHHTFHVNHMYV